MLRNDTTALECYNDIERFTFTSLAEAVQFLVQKNIKNPIEGIMSALTNHRRKIGGYYWRYL